MNRLFLLLFIILSVSASVLAGSTDPVPPLSYLSENDVSGIFQDSRVQPPSADSATDRNDLLEVRKLEKSRSKEDCQKAIIAASAGIETLFAGILSPSEATILGKCLNFGTPFSKEIDHYVIEVKNKFLRPRPFERPGEVYPVKVCEGGRLSSGTSFPSGHSALGYAQGLILSQIFPDRKVAIMKMAEEIGTDRVVLGVHYPSDVEAGRIIAEKVIQALHTNEKFKKSLRLCTDQLTPSSNDVTKPNPNAIKGD